MSAFQRSRDIVKVQQIKQSVNLEGLEDWGTAGLPGTAPVRVSGVQKVIKGSEAIDTGIFECSAGTGRQDQDARHGRAGSRRGASESLDLSMLRYRDVLDIAEFHIGIAVRGFRA